MRIEPGAPRDEILGRSPGDLKVVQHRQDAGRWKTRSYVRIQAKGDTPWLAATVRPTYPGLQFCAIIQEQAMACKACGAESIQELVGELTASFPDISRSTLPPIYVCQRVVVCLECGFTEMVLPEGELELLKRGRAASG